MDTELAAAANKKEDVCILISPLYMAEPMVGHETLK